MKTYLRPVVRSLPLLVILTFLLPASAWCADQPSPQRHGFFARLFARSPERSASRASGPRVIVQRTTTLTAYESSSSPTASQLSNAAIKSTPGTGSLLDFSPLMNPEVTGNVNPAPGIETVSTSSIQPTIETVSLSSPEKTAVAAAAPAKSFPTAAYLSYGRVQVPFPPYSTVDVEGLASGSLAKDPVSGKVFRVP